MRLEASLNDIQIMQSLKPVVKHIISHHIASINGRLIATIGICYFIALMMSWTHLLLLADPRAACCSLQLGSPAEKISQTCHRLHQSLECTPD